MAVLEKKQMSEEDIKLNFITPAIQPSWSNHITMETQITDGRINIKGNLVARSKPKRADYLLYLNGGKPIAVVEAKDNNHSISHGLQQAIEYARMMDLPFAYSSNGDAFYEHDLLTGQERQIPLDQFPTQEELFARFYSEANKGAGYSEKEKKVVNQPYYSSQSTYPPRYYQRNAVNRTVEAIARGRERLLLVMATGTGKTYTAFQIVYRLLRSDLKKRILYLADRNILVDQSILQDFAPLEKTIYKVDFSDKDCLNKISSHEVNFALYHQMVGQNDEEHFKQIPAGYFDLIIVDEAHRMQKKPYMYKGDDMLRDAIYASRVSVFFVDEGQRVTTSDCYDIDMIKQYAEEQGAILETGDPFVLQSQFRCNGSDGYLAFVDDVLEIRETANKELDTKEYDFRVFDNPSAMREALRILNSERNKARLCAGIH